MMDMQGLIQQLEYLKELLNREKSVLVNNEGEQLEPLVKRKLDIMQQISGISEGRQQLEYTQNEKEIYNRLLGEIKELQELNLLLTHQSLNYTGAVLNSLRTAAGGQESYGRDGITRNSGGSSAIVDHSV